MRQPAGRTGLRLKAQGAAAPVRNFASIDAMRGWAILAVVAVHSSIAVAPATPWLGALMREGALGVQLFFVASALALCMSLEGRYAREAQPILNFFIRRFFRIAPMFWLAALFYTWFNGREPAYWAPDGVEAWALPMTLLFLHGLRPETINSVVPGGWSIAVEAWFYVLLPAIFPYLFSARRVLALLVASVAVAHFAMLLWSRLYPSPPNEPYLVFAFAQHNIVSQLPVFVCGVLLFQVLRLNWPPRRVLLLGGAALLASAWLCVVGHWRLPQHVAAGALFFSGGLLLVRFPVSLLVNRVTVGIGTLSFSVYLVHFAVLSLLKKAGVPALLGQGDLASVGYFLLVLLLSSAVAVPTYAAIEKPGIRWGSMLVARREHARAAGA